MRRTQSAPVPRVFIITGHFGSGKSEFSINLALRLATQFSRVSLADVDVVNPYFRSRERRGLLEEHGIKVIASTIGIDHGVDLPALSAEIYGPLRDRVTRTVIDAGGDPAGARVLGSFRRYLDRDETDVLCVVNAARPATANVTAVLEQIREIERVSGLQVDALINNTHMLEQTEIADVEAGNQVCREVSQRTGLPIRYVGVTARIVDRVPADIAGELMPIAMHLREAWMET